MQDWVLVHRADFCDEVKYVEFIFEQLLEGEVAFGVMVRLVFILIIRLVLHFLRKSLVFVTRQILLHQRLKLGKFLVALLIYSVQQAQNRLGSFYYGLVLVETRARKFKDFLESGEVVSADAVGVIIVLVLLHVLQVSDHVIELLQRLP